MSKHLGFSVTLCLVSAVFVGTDVHAVDVPEVSGPPVTIQSGEERKSKRFRNGEEITQTARLIDDGKTLEVSRDDGCTWTRATDDLYGPSLTWDNCSKSAWGTGKATDIKKSGQLWPLKVGNKVKYRFKNTNSKGKTNPNAFKNCKVEDKVMATAGGKDYPSYKVHCYEHNGTRTYYYAPSVGSTVVYERVRNKGRRDKAEFLEWL